MRFEVGCAQDGRHTVVRQADGRPIIQGQDSLRFVQQMVDVLNKEDIDVEAMEPFPELGLAYSHPERVRQQSLRHSEVLRRTTAAISAAYERQGVTRIHV